MLPNETLKNIYLQKVEFLTNGLRIGEGFYESLKIFGIETFNRGRRGGAGPAGGRYFLFENNVPVNVPLWGSKSEKSYLILEKALGQDKDNNLYCRIHNEKTGETYDNIRLISGHDSYNNAENLDNTTNKQIALVHGTSCLASTIAQECKYWREGKECAFCGIELSLKSGATTKFKTAEQLIQAIMDAKKEGLSDHITLTSGTLPTDDKGGINYINVVSKIKDKFPDLPIHIQIEAFANDSMLMEMKKAGVDTIGIHLEIPDDTLRKKYCPGKAEIPRGEFEDLWKRAVKVFGWGQVSTFILVGLDEDIDELIEYNDKIISWGVVPNIMPVRYIMDTNFEPKWIGSEQMIKLYDAAAKSFLKHGLNPLKNKAGCIRCSGCSAINDAYRYYLTTI